MMTDFFRLGATRSTQIAGVLAILLSPALNAQSSTRDEARRSIRMSYGTVDTIARARMQSEVGSNAVLGGIIGAAATHDRHARARNATAGAAIGALLTKASENRHRMDEITILLANGSRVKVIQDHVDGIAIGGCVSLEEGIHTNVRAVSAEFCTSADPHADATVSSQRQGEAAACNEAKEQLVAARTDEELEFISKKIRILCH